MKLSDIKRHGGQMLGLSREDMNRKGGLYRVVHARQMVMAVARKFNRSSMPEIGRRFGGRHHTTVLHASRAVAARCAASPDTARRVSELCAVLEIELHAAQIRRLNAQPAFAGLLPPPPRADRAAAAYFMGPYPFPHARPSPFIGLIATAVLHPQAAMVVPCGRKASHNRKVFAPC